MSNRRNATQLYAQFPTIRQILRNSRKKSLAIVWFADSIPRPSHRTWICAI